MLKLTIPFVDLRGKTQTDLLRAYPDKATALLASSRRSFGAISFLLSGLLLPLSDRRSHRWLRRAADPYLHEVESAADILGKKGVYTLNLAYEWGCTSGAYMTADGVSLLRVLDWPFPALGKHIIVALQKTSAGEFYNVTWPAISGMYQGMAPGRFAASINQAPMRMFGLGYAGDWLVNRFRVNRNRALPPSHLLRKVFEQAHSYAEAKEMLCKTPIAIPAIFTLTGTMPGEGCVIERLENAAEIMELSVAQSVSASNEFHSDFAARGRGWRPRAEDSAGRYKQSCSINMHDVRQEAFGWLRAPMVNALTRLVMKADAATGALIVQGFEGQAEVTNPFVIAPTLAKEA
jgi:hypothetical protein